MNDKLINNGYLLFRNVISKHDIEKTVLISYYTSIIRL